MYIDADHILQGDNVEYRPLPEARTQPGIVPWSIILHSNAGPHWTRWQQLWAYMNRTDIVIEAHLLVDMVGTVAQMIPFNRRADCNAKANSWSTGAWNVGAISIETQDMGASTLPDTVWPIPQFDALVNVVAALGHKYGIPYTAPAAWNDRGVGHHCAFKEWSVYVGKTCPGAARIRQMDYLRTRAAETCACPP